MSFFESPSFRRTLTGGTFVVTVWLFYTEALKPLGQQKEESVRKLAEVKGRAEDAHRTIRDIKSYLEESEPRARQVEKSEQTLPVGPTLVWFPHRMTGHFRRFGFGEAVARLNTALEEPELPGYQRTYWATDVPLRSDPKNLTELLLAVAELEVAEPMVRVIDLAIRTDSEGSAERTAVVTLSVLSRE